MKNMLALSAMSVVVLILMAGCGEEEEGDRWEIEDQTLQGTINGEPWEHTSGEASVWFDDGEFWLDIYAEAEDPCAVSFSMDGADHRKIITTVSDTAGEYPLNMGQSITFSYPVEVVDENTGELEEESYNLAATRGLLVIDEVTEEMVTGGLVAEVDADNSVNGTFELTRCENL